MPHVESTDLIRTDRAPNFDAVGPAVSLRNRRRLVGLSIYFLVVSALFFRPLVDLVRFASSAQHYSHILMVPVISAYLVMLRRPQLSIPFRSSYVLALVPFFVGVALFYFDGWSERSKGSVGDRQSLVALIYLSFFLTGCFAFVGKDVMKRLVFPTAFLLFAVPMPDFLLESIETFLQYASADAAHGMLWLSRVPLFRNGLEFRMPGIAIRVAQECSGFNSTFVLFMISLVAGDIFLKTTWRKVVFSLFVLPLAILRNGFRITTISLLCVYVDPNMIDSAIHHRGGPLFFALSLIPFGGVLYYLSKTESSKEVRKLHPNATE